MAGRRGLADGEFHAVLEDHRVRPTAQRDDVVRVVPRHASRLPPLGREGGKKLPDQEGRNTIKVNVGSARSVADMATIVRSPAKVVMQRPMWSHALHKLPPHPSILVIFLARNCLDVR